MSIRRAHLVMAMAGVLFISLQAKAQTDPPPDPALAAPSFWTNNTAACSKVGGGYAGYKYCAAPFPDNTWFDEVSGWAEEQNVLSPNQILTVYHNPSPAGNYSGGAWTGLWNISKGRLNGLDMDSLMYGSGTTTASTKVVVELQSWFCVPAYVDSGYGCAVGSPYYPQGGDPNEQYVNENQGHAVVQYTTWYQPTMDGRTLDIWDRGGEVVAWDWYGGPTDCPTSTSDFHLTNYTAACSHNSQYSDHSYRDMVTSIQTTLPQKRTGANMSFFIIEDQGAWNNSGVCSAVGQNEPWCATNKIIADFMYAQATYFNQTSYLKNGTNPARPVIAFFQDEAPGDNLTQCTVSTPCRYNDNGNTCTSQSSCYQNIYAQVRSWLDGNFGTNAYYMIFAYQSGCPVVHPYSDGCYLWVKPHVSTTGTQGITTSNQLYDDPTNSSSNPKQQADNFYQNSIGQTGANGQPALIMGGAYKGFDNWMANWWSTTQDKLLSQECGTTWLSSWSEMNQWYNATTNPLPYMMVETWDDYEEGTEIETGISNCIDDSQSTASISNTTNLGWTFTFVDPNAMGTQNTIHHYILYYYTSATGYRVKDGNITATKGGCKQTNNVLSCTGVNLANYTWTHGTQYTLYIQSVGKAGLTNHVSPAVTYNP
jgi:hypothetical protein